MGGLRNREGRTNTRRANPQVLKGELSTSRAEKGGHRTGDEAEETRSRSRAAGDDIDLGSMLMEARQ